MSIDGKLWTPELIGKGCAYAGVGVKSISMGKDEGRFDAQGVNISYSPEGEGKVKVVLSASDPNAKKLIPEITNGIGMSLVPKDVIRKSPLR